MRADHYGLISLGLDGLIRKHDVETIDRVFNANKLSYGMVGATNNMYSTIRRFIDDGLRVRAEKEGVDSSVLIVDVHDSFQQGGYNQDHINTAMKAILRDKHFEV